MYNYSNTYVVIMAGGIGSRFWPVSRNNFPKQFLDILGVGKSLLQLTYERFLPICKPENIFVVTNIQYENLVIEQLPQLGKEQLILEPVRKNTAPCIALASYKINEINPKANIIIAASDHLILNESVYLEVIKQGLLYVTKKNHLLTLGIRPTRADTGYGYIQYVDDNNDTGVFKVKTFTEKPTKELAEQFVKSGEFLWNSGMFLWNVKTILKAIQNYTPDIFEAFKGFEKVIGKKNEKEFVSQAFSVCANISIDFGIMEKASNVRVIPSKFGWSDVGTWASLYEIMKHDFLGNAVTGNQVMVYDAHNNMINVPNDKLTIIQGLSNYIVVDTPNALLICEQTSEQKIKDFTVEVKRNGGDKYL
jgi:mannose-1-phosphate guanylyltransferase